jgi:hypothetical protein
MASYYSSDTNSLEEPGRTKISKKTQVVKKLTYCRLCIFLKSFIEFQKHILKNLQFDKPGKKQEFEANDDVAESSRPKRKPKQREKFDIQLSIPFSPISFSKVRFNFYGVIFLIPFYLDDAPLYDGNGLLNISKQDICDCLRPNCPGCHFPCKQCESGKCGNKCRNYRNWFYKRIEYEGSSNILNMQNE